MIPRHLELATYLTNQWSLLGEVCDDMNISKTNLTTLITNAQKRGIGIEREDGKIRLKFNTSVKQVELALASQKP